MQCCTTDFLLFIFGGKFGVSNQMVTERKVSSDRGITVSKAMNLNLPRAGTRIVQRAITPPVYAVCAVPFIAKSLYGSPFRVECGQARNDGHQIENGFGSDVRD